MSAPSSTSIPSPPSDEPPSLPSSSSSGSPGLIAGIAIGTVIGVAVLLGLGLFLYFRKPPRHRDEYDSSHTFHLPPPPSEPYSPSWQVRPLVFVIYSHTPPPYSPSCQVNNSEGSGSVPPLVVEGGSFKYDDLKLATNGFAVLNLLGQGQFGLVYRGMLRGKDVAIKKLKSLRGGPGDREFRADVKVISRVHHRNLGSLVGYCVHEDQRWLVYEYVPNKTLDFHLHGSGRPTLNWHRRWKIALGSAKGLAYLHDHCDPKIIHRNIKAANILLDYNFEPKVADFGLAKFVLTNKSHVSARGARDMGSFRYVAPEYASSGTLTEMSDVYSFGVVLLELITGRKPVMSSDPSLVDWARPLLIRASAEGIYDELIDPRLETNYDPYDMTRLIHCATAAVRYSARYRPRMGQIARYLEGEISLEELNPGLEYAE